MNTRCEQQARVYSAPQNGAGSKKPRFDSPRVQALTKWWRSSDEPLQEHSANERVVTTKHAITIA